MNKISNNMNVLKIKVKDKKHIDNKSITYCKSYVFYIDK